MTITELPPARRVEATPAICCTIGTFVVDADRVRFGRPDSGGADPLSHPLSAWPLEHFLRASGADSRDSVDQEVISLSCSPPLIFPAPTSDQMQPLPVLCCSFRVSHRR